MSIRSVVGDNHSMLSQTSVLLLGQSPQRVNNLWSVVTAYTDVDTRQPVLRLRAGIGCHLSLACASAAKCSDLRLVPLLFVISPSGDMPRGPVSRSRSVC